MHKITQLRVVMPSHNNRFIKQPNGSTITLDVELSQTVNQVKSKLKTYVNITNPKLIFRGKILMDNNTLNHYDIKHEYTLLLKEDTPLNHPIKGIQSTIQTNSSSPQKYDASENKSNNNDELAVLLVEHNLYDILYIPLRDTVEMEDLRHLKPEEVDSFADAIDLKIKQKVKFRILMKHMIKERDAKKQQSSNNYNEYNYESQVALAKQRSLEEDQRQHKKIDIDEYQAKQKSQEYFKNASLEPDDKMTVVLVGDMGAGKTSLMSKYCHGVFDPRVTSTIGVDSMTTIQPLSNNTNMGVTVWDTAGQERFQSIGRAYYKKADCMIICYDISVDNPFRNFEHWWKQIKEHGTDEVVVIMVGCKTDLATNDDRTQMNRAMAMSIIEERKWRQFNAMQCECSSKTGHNVNNVFIACAELVLQCRNKGSKEGKISKGDLKRQNEELRKRNQELSRKVEEFEESKGIKTKDDHDDALNLEAMQNATQPKQSRCGGC